MRGLIDRLKTGRMALAALGLVTALGGTAALTSAAQAYDHDGYRDREWRHERNERDHWRHEEREREWRRWHYYRERPAYYYAPPAYYAPPRGGYYYYGDPNVSFGFNIR